MAEKIVDTNYNKKKGKNWVAKKQGEKTNKDIAEKLETASSANFATKQKLKQNLYGKDVVKAELLNVADEIFLHTEKK